MSTMVHIPVRVKPLEIEVDRKSTRLNSSHLVISYAVFCLKKKKIASSDERPQAQHPSQLCLLAGTIEAVIEPFLAYAVALILSCCSSMSEASTSLYSST